MNESDDLAQFSIGELASLGGVNRRTVRYYVQRGLLEAPGGTGRGRHYTQSHLDTLLQIRQLQEAGRSLDEIARTLRGEPSQASPSGAARMEDGDAVSKKGAEGQRAAAEGVMLAGPGGVGALPQRRRWARLTLAEGLELHLRMDRFDLDDEDLARLVGAVRGVLDTKEG